VVEETPQEPHDPEKIVDIGTARRSQGSKSIARGNGDGNGAANTRKEHASSPYVMKPRGLYFCDPEGAANDLFLSSPFEILAETRDKQGESWGLHLEWLDHDGRKHLWAMPKGLLASDGSEARRILIDGGLEIASGAKARNLFTNYLMQQRSDGRARAVMTTGWHGHIFVFPDCTIGRVDGDEHIIVQTGHHIDHAYNVRGTLEDWQTNVAKYTEGNSCLTLAISMAFAAALIGPCGAESGGIHLRGHSSRGKTTALRVAGSVWGGDIDEPDGGYIRSWRATANGLEGTGTIHNDTLLCLDEISQLAAKEAGEAAYMLSNGQGKSRASREATLRKPARWRTLFLSSGEKSLADKIAEDMRGRRQTAGQAVRVIDLPADAGAYGLFETLHDFADAASFADHLRSASSQFYGTAARAFIEAIATDLDAVATAIKEAVAQFVAEQCGEDADGQVRRVAYRFGLIAAAGEMAISLEIVPWQPKTALDAATKCFQVWLDARGGKGAAEEKDGVEAVRAFLSREQCGASASFLFPRCRVLRTGEFTRP